MFDYFELTYEKTTIITNQIVHKPVRGKHQSMHKVSSFGLCKVFVQIIDPKFQDQLWSSKIVLKHNLRTSSFSGLTDQNCVNKVVGGEVHY